MDHCVDELGGLVEAPAKRREHRVPRRRHDHGGGVPGGRSGSLEHGQGGLRLADPTQFHEGYEAPEQAVLLPVGVPGPLCEVDHLGGGGEPVLGRGRLPERVQAGPEDVGQHPAVAGATRARAGFVDQGPATRAGRGLSE